MKSLWSAPWLALLLPAASAVAADVDFRAFLEDEPRYSFVSSTSPYQPVLGLMDLSDGSNFAQMQVRLDGVFGPKWRASATGALVDLYDGSHSSRFLTRELYVDCSATDAINIFAGRRILRWGVGYALNPTGVVDPHRNPTDPDDRLNLNIGRDVIGLDLTRGSQSFNLVLSQPNLISDGRVSGEGAQAAMRYSFLVHGIDAAVIGSWVSGHPDRAGCNATFVVGQGLEIHAEWALQWGSDALGLQPVPGPSGDGPRSLFARLRTGSEHRFQSCVAGINWTHSNGWNFVAEYYRNGDGLTDDEWNRYVGFLDRNERMAGQDGAYGPPEMNLLLSAKEMTGGNLRRNYAFLRISKDPLVRDFSVDMLFLGSLDGSSGGVGVVEIYRPIGRFLTASFRVTQCFGPPGSEYRVLPVSGSVSLGLRANF
ncbi:MAG: hypothetical protein AB1714_21545 [Acidobacteriota bacterium]